MFYNRKLLLVLGATISLSTLSPMIVVAEQQQRYDYAIVNEGDKLIGECQKQLTKIRVCLAAITPILKKNGTYKKEFLEKIITHLQMVDSALEGFEKRKFTDTGAGLWIHQLMALNEGVIDHISQALQTNFKHIDSYDLNTLIIKAMGTKSAFLDPQTIADQLIRNNKKLEQLTKKAQGLHWYNHIFRAMDDWVITPCQKYHIPRRVVLATALLLAIETPWWEYYKTSHEATHKFFLGDSVYDWTFGKHPTYVGGSLKWENTLGQFGRAKVALFEFATNASLTKVVGTAVGGLALVEGKHLYPTVQKWATVLRNKLKGGVYHKEAERAAQKVDHVRFKDIFGQHEIKRYLQHLVDYLEDPESADRLGLTPPKGILFVGDTRTGKTFCVNALFGEINDMLERTGQADKYKMWNLDPRMIKREGMDNLLRAVKHTAPCIVFIDEIDLLYLQRAGANETLTEFLTAMGEAVNSNDSKKQVIVIAATNRPETLDVALRQPGRFGKELRFEYPNYEDRLTFIKNRLAELAFNVNDLDVAKLAQYTENKSYEALNMLIKNAIIKARLRGVLLNQEILDESLDEDIYHIIPNYTKQIPQHELDILAAHFAGQALAMHLMDNSVQLAKVTIKQVMTELKEEFMWTHLADNSSEKKEQQQRFEYGKIFTCHAQDSINMNSQATKLKLCKMYVAGFMAEELLLGSCSYSCHAESDKQNALTLAQSIVFEGLDRKTMPKHVEAEKYDQALAIVEQCKKEVKELLSQNMDTLKRLSDALLEHKTLDHDQVKKILHPEPEAPKNEPLAQQT